MTLDGTWTYILGHGQCIVIDPGPDDAGHLDGITSEIDGADVAGILLTHLHDDHAAGADALAIRLDTDVRAIGRGTLADGDVVGTDAGDIVAIHTPGHTPDHASFHWLDSREVFCGDLMMGGLETALVAPPEGDLGGYLASLARLRDLDPVRIHPAHGPSFDRPIDAIDAYVRHREARLRQVLGALSDRSTDLDAIADAVYGRTIPDALRAVAREATLAYLEHLEREGRIMKTAAGWASRAPA